MQGYAPIHLACDRGKTEIVRILLERGADTAIKVLLHLLFFFLKPLIVFAPDFRTQMGILPQI
jgi:ankyrin repeat protein